MHWYQLAAEQGFARAQLNLGSMYERGLGVARDPGKAIDLYRRASGLAAANLDYVPAEDVSRLRDERDALTRTLEAEREDRARLQRELDETRAHLESDRSALDRSRQDLNMARRELEARVTALEERRLALAAASRADAERGEQQKAAEAELADLRRDLEVQRRVVQERDAQLNLASASVARLENQAAVLRGEIEAAQARRTGDLARAETEARAARDQLAQLRERLSAAEASQAQGQRRMDDQAAEVSRLRLQLEATKGQASSATSGRAAIEAQLVAREAELADTRGRLETLKQDLARLRRESGALRETAASGQARATPPGLPAGFTFGRFNALIIGNNNHKFMPPLESAINDAKAVEQVLRDRYGFKTTLLLDADRYQVLAALNTLRTQLTDQDNLLIYYAGHGELDQVNNRGYWLPVDAEADSSANWISSIQITDVLNAMTAKQILLVADSCYSGMLTRAAVARLDAGMSEEERLRWLKAMATKRARLVLSSGGVQPVLDGGGGDHSVFAAAFLKVLEENRGVLETQRLATAVIEQVAVSAAGASIDQVPVYAPIRFAGHEAGDFFFVARN